MYSFKDLDGSNIPFEFDEITLNLINDFETKEITGYLIYVEDTAYEVSEKTYNSMKDHKSYKR